MIEFNIGKNSRYGNYIYSQILANLHCFASLSVGYIYEQTSGESRTTLQEKYTIFINNKYSLCSHIIIDQMLNIFNNR